MFTSRTEKRILNGQCPMEDGRTPVFSHLPFAISHQAPFFSGLLDWPAPPTSAVMWAGGLHAQASPLSLWNSVEELVRCHWNEGPDLNWVQVCPAGVQHSLPDARSNARGVSAEHSGTQTVVVVRPRAIRMVFADPGRVVARGTRRRHPNATGAGQVAARNGLAVRHCAAPLANAMP